jgi:large subunit ribosomal protein L13
MPTQTFNVDPEGRAWFVVDASEYPLGRLASRVANVLRGKHKPIYSPHLDHGDHVVVVNAGKVQLTGKKLDQKTYFRHTGHMGGGRLTTLKDIMSNRPEEAVYRAVKGMLPKNPLGRSMLKKLRVYPGAVHPHESQNPVPLPDHLKA